MGSSPTRIPAHNPQAFKFQYHTIPIHISYTFRLNLQNFEEFQFVLLDSFLTEDINQDMSLLVTGLFCLSSSLNINKLSIDLRPPGYVQPATGQNKLSCRQRLIFFGLFIDNIRWKILYKPFSLS